MPDPTDDNPLLTAALDYAGRGWPVLPLHQPTAAGCSCGHADCPSPAKHPRTPHGLKDATLNADTIRRWWARWPEANIGVRTGIAFDAIDIDGDQGHAAVTVIEQERGKAPPGPTSWTGGGGTHRLYEPTGIGNRAGILDHVDWRGRNGYIVAPPSRHMSGGRYEWGDQAAPDEAPLEPVTGWLHELLFPPTPERPPPAAGLAVAREAGRGDYGRAALEAELAELARAQPGTRNNQLNESAFNLYQLAAGGELDERAVDDALARTAAAIGLGERETAQTIKSARKAGHAQPRAAPAMLILARPAPRVVPFGQPNGNGGGNGTLGGPDGDPADPTGWEPVDVAGVIASGCEIPPAAHYARADGVNLLYTAKIHAFNGEPETGKSFAAQHACTQLLNADLEVCYLDFEDSPQSVIGRLIALGASEHHLLTRFTYIAPVGPFTHEAFLVLRHHFTARPPALAVIDGITEAMATLGLDSNDNGETAQFFRILPRRLARLGASVVLVDHVAKNVEGRGRWALGAQHKMAALDGAAYTFDTLLPFGRGRHGIAKLTVTKDRPGHIRQHANGTTIAELHLDATNGAFRAELKPPSGGEFLRPTRLMERISKALEAGPALSTRALYAKVGGNRENFELAREMLTSEGYLFVVKQGQTLYHSSRRPYRETADTATESVMEPFP